MPSGFYIFVQYCNFENVSRIQKEHKYEKSSNVKTFVPELTKQWLEQFLFW